jgi:hypothetical protein
MDDQQQPKSTGGHLDVDAERKRLDEMGKHIKEVRNHAGEDLEPGGKGRLLPDERIHREVIENGDAPLHPRPAAADTD